MGINETEILRRLASKIEAISVTFLAYVFLTDGTGGHIGQFDRQFLYSPKDLDAIQR